MSLEETLEEKKRLAMGGQPTYFAGVTFTLKEDAKIVFQGHSCRVYCPDGREERYSGERTEDVKKGSVIRVVDGTAHFEHQRASNT